MASCEGCGADMHQDCRRELGRCPTLGCAASAKAGATSSIVRDPTDGPEARPSAHHPSPRPWARLGPYARLAFSGTLTLLFVLGCIGFFLWPILSWETFWHFVATNKRGQDPSALRALFFGGALAAGAGGAGFWALTWLIQVPAVFAEVRQLLDETEPVPMLLTIRKEGTGKETKHYADLRGTGAAISLHLGGILPPWWLLRARPGTRVYVYGLPPPGPYLIEMPSGLLALVHPDDQR